MAPLTVKILGSGNAAKKHQAAFAELPELYQIVDSHAADIIDICTPPYLHFPQAKQALLSGSHALVEKPVCGSLSECDELLEIEKQTGKKVCPVFQYRFADHDPIKKHAQLLSVHWHRTSDYWNGWHGQWSKALGGALASHSIHLIDLAIQKFGSPRMVGGSLHYDMHLHTAVENGAQTMLFWQDHSTTIETLLEPKTPELTFWIGDSKAGYFGLFHMLHVSLTTNDWDFPPTLTEARQSLEVVTGAYWSAFESYGNGPLVTLPIFPDHPFYHGWTQAFAERASRPDTRSQAFQKTL